jgi:hypothetical protein
MGDFQQIKAAIVTRDPGMACRGFPGTCKPSAAVAAESFSADLRRLE